MVKIYSDWIVVTKDDPSYLPLSMNLVKVDKGRKVKNKRGREVITPDRTLYLYNVIENDAIVIPQGLLFLINNYFNNSKVIDMRKRSPLENTETYISEIEKYRNILDGITLKNEQIFALRKILYSRRCIIQLATGAGKTEILCALVKILTDVNNGTIPTTLVFEPSIKLVNDTVSRFNLYGIPVVKYSDSRKITKNVVNVCHPISIGNDVEKDSMHLNDVEVLLCDETHHMASESFRKPKYYMHNLSYSVGVSASAVRNEHVGSDNISDYTYSELLTMGALGPVVMNVKAGFLIDNDKLASPVLFMVRNLANEKLRDEDINNWNKICSIRLESEKRVRLVAESAQFFHSVKRKSIILVSTVRWARSIMKVLDEFGLTEYTRASFGGGVFEKYDKDTEQFVNDTSDVFDKFNKGEYDILIGTSHLYEGADVKNLDTMILAYGGKSERLQIQGIGRVLRKTKTGKYAYIVDFTDSNDLVLSKHSKLRLERYRDIMNIPEDHIFYDISVSDFGKIFDHLEDGKSML